MKKKFVHRKIGEPKRANNDSHIWWFNKKSLIHIIVTILCIICIGYFGKFLIHASQNLIQYMGKSAITIVSQKIGKEMITDEFWNINIMFLGYGWGEHHWGYLADSIIVASRNQKLWAITMISVPRDFYIANKEARIYGRINEAFSRGTGREKNYTTWAKLMINQLEDIMGITIPYYALIDFAGFKDVIDTLGGIEINVENAIYDTAYPTENLGYTTFKVDVWVQMFSGERALMYARSRHSTSDFDRSLRQQQIIKAIMAKFMSQKLTPNTIKELYKNYTAMVKTNISLDEILGLIDNKNDIKHMFSYGLTTYCSNVAYKNSHPGCFLYSPEMSDFGGASVILPIGADKNNPWFYEYINNFAFYVMHNQEYLIENPTISIINGIDKQYARQQKLKADWYANQLAVKLKKYAFTISWTANADTPYLWTELYILGTGNYEATISTIKNFVTIDNTVDLSTISLEETFMLKKEIAEQKDKWADLLVILGNNYIDRLKLNKFNYYR
jgi:polyisoprenyl-teichoic acid--peptidoglycan teichoic acid transferase